MKSYDDIFAELSKSTSDMLDSGLADPNEETNAILRNMIDADLKEILKKQRQEINQIKKANKSSTIFSSISLVISILAIAIAVLQWLC